MESDWEIFERTRIENLEKRCIDLLKHDSKETEKIYQQCQDLLIEEYEKQRKIKERNQK